MAFYGPFVSIARCASLSINELRFAERDAATLYALLNGAFGGENSLFTKQTPDRDLTHLAWAVDHYALESAFMLRKWRFSVIKVGVF
jgi:hypothetical protein